MEIYKIENLTFSYPETDEKALDDISFSVNDGEFITICGYSGCGKSTLLRQLKTCLQPYGKRSGNIIFENSPLEKTDFETQSRKIGFVTQSPDNQSVTDKVWHELAFGLESLSLDSNTIRKRVAEMAAFFGIEQWFDKNISELSGGQKQILNLASVMVMQPTVLILDEPTSQLDPIASDEFISAIRKINLELGTTIIISEHHLDEVFSLSDRVIVMSDGKIISDDSPENTGKILYAEKNPMFSALPSPVRIYSYAEDKTTHKVPLTVSEGRKWLSEYVKNKPVKPLETEIPVSHTKPPVLELKNIWFRYEKNLPDVLKGVNLKAYSGEFLAILGGNGTGKTTIFSVIGGINKAYRGKVLINGKDISKEKNVYNTLAILPQNPATLFVKNTVEEDLYDVFSETHLNKEIIKQKIQTVISLCELEHLKSRHPFDLSGGEQQRAALAKVLLTNPKILLLDEPTKGLDTLFKQKFAKIIRTLVSQGLSVIMVSHDIEFCAEYTDRCTMFFNGSIVSENTPRAFFSENRFYTTSANRMSRRIIQNAVTVNDVLYALGKDIEDNTKNDFDDNIKVLYENLRTTDKDINKNSDDNSEKLPLWRKIIVFISFLLFVFSTGASLDIFEIPYFSENKILSYSMVFISLIMIVFSLGIKHKTHSINSENSKSHKLTKRTISAIVMIFAAIPITIFIGIYYLNDQKYLFISLLVMLECMLPFFLVFEKRRIQARELVLIASLCALCISGRAVFYMLPQFKPVTALVILSGAALGGESGFLVGAVTMLVSNMFFGQGAWTPWQMFSMGIIGFLSGIIYRKGLLPKNRISFALFGFISATIIYGGIMNPASLIMSHTEINPSTLAAFYLSGLPMDIIHGLSTAVFLYIGAETVLQKLERIKTKYGLIV